MHILGISSATKVISVGLIDEDKILVETTVSDIQAEKIVFYVKEAGVKPEQIEGVAATVGPGSYSGLRGGLAAAKSLAQALKVPLVGVSTLEAIAYNLVNIEGAMAVILDAKADEYSFALFGASGGRLNRLTEDLVIKLEDLANRISRISGDIWVAGNIREIKWKIKESEGKKIHFVEEVHSHPYGINVAKLGLFKIKSGQKDDPLKLAPLYSHKPNIREYKV